MRYQIISWAKNIALAIAALFFFIFGVDLLIASYSLNNPLLFIGVFFSSCLIILVSLAGLVYCWFAINNLRHELSK